MGRFISTAFVAASLAGCLVLVMAWVGGYEGSPNPVWEAPGLVSGTRFSGAINLANIPCN
jgi:hypothetical protein